MGWGNLIFEAVSEMYSSMSVKYLGKGQIV